MSFRFLIDECLSPSLATIAHMAGHVATSVRDMGWNGLTDQQLMVRVIEGDYTLVTINSRDFRGPAGGPVAGLHARETLHAGLVCLNGHGRGLGMLRQQALFKHALDVMPGDMVNRALEVWDSEDGSLTVQTYPIPCGSQAVGAELAREEAGTFNDDAG
ncbi:DUF5615 family PIN-like protein [Pseudomonas sp. REP124]|uniref:DUF5615 family PIN-like protein n=1 Tax=Pseudomonas sp. REP124 TaxID=2875731 RepID=UPI001CCAA236|nr:DUF5615 family PIN-like protein [Pseudomonas sp. REP124]MBZ9779992.1 DUF5615 family PIN-like protein [Pseudomonas sp. REP124]